MIFHCIYKQGDERSEVYLQEALESAKKFNIPVQPYPGIYSNINNIIKNEQLFINPLGKYKIKHNGVLGCFLSHYFLWHKCLRKRIPIGILEYDAIFRKPLPNFVTTKFSHYLHLDYNRHIYLDHPDYDYLTEVEKDHRPFSIEELKEKKEKAKLTRPFKYINNNNIRGAFGYIIKPSGARLLIEATKKYGILPADIQPNLLYCKIHYSVPSIVMLNPTSLFERTKYSHTTNDRTFD